MKDKDSKLLSEAYLTIAEADVDGDGVDDATQQDPNAIPAEAPAEEAPAEEAPAEPQAPAIDFNAMGQQAAELQKSLAALGDPGIDESIQAIIGQLQARANQATAGDPNVPQQQQ